MRKVQPRRDREFRIARESTTTGAAWIIRNILFAILAPSEPQTSLATKNQLAMERKYDES
jgi:hypothetical protein